MPIAYLPLDDRPCNKDFPSLLARIGKVKLIVASNKSDFKLYFKTAESSIISIDRWVYGGLVESRKPGLTLQQTQLRMRDLRKLFGARHRNVLAFTVLLRQAPTALSEDDEKKAELINIASRLHRNKASFKAILKLIPKHVWEEYLQTRKRNFSVNRKAIEFSRNGSVSFLAIAMDDLTPEGFNWQEARHLKDRLPAKRNMAQILAGADEMGMLLFARRYLASHHLFPKICPFYSNARPEQFRLRYDALPLRKILKSQLDLLGAELMEDPRKADLFLFVHSPQEDQLDVPLTEPEPNFSYRWMKMLQSFLVRGKPCVLADLRFTNGADASLMRTLNQFAPLERLFGFSGWNTAANALGMALSQSAVRWAAERAGELDIKSHENLLCLRILEDWFYQAEVRTELLKRLRKEGKPVLRLDKTSTSELSREVSEKLNQLARRYLPKHFPGLKVTEVNFPWSRLFDIEIKFQTR